MNLKCLSQRLSPAGLVLALGLVFSPESVGATVLESIETKSQELHQPTLLINTPEQVSVLTENISSSNSDSTENLVVATATSNTSSANGDLGKNNTSATSSPSFEERLKTSANSFVSAEKFVVADNRLNTGENQVQSPSLIQTQSISIPIEVENPQSATGASAVNIPVVPPSNQFSVQQPTGGNSQNVITLDVEQPRFVSNKPQGNSTSAQRSERVNVASIPSEPSLDNISQNNASQNPDLVSVVPIQIEYYNPTMSPAIGDMGSPNLPSINSPDPYLPDSQRPFNGYIWPAKGVFTSGYGWRWGRMHRGIDIAAPVGTPIFAAADGEVIFSGWNSGGYGNLVRIKHPDGSVTLYAHNSKLLVRRGQYVTQGQQIAKMGSTGFSTGPHLHFEIHPNGSKAVDPIAFLPRR